MLGWAIAYVTVGLVASAAVLARREPTIVRGDWVFFLTAFYVLVATVATVVRGDRITLGALAMIAVVLMAAWLVRTRWWVIGAASHAVTITLQDCAARLCAPASLLDGECTVAVPGGAVRLRIAPVTTDSTMIVFIASTRHRKTELFRRLLAKQYRSVVPPIRIGGPRSA